MIRNIGRFHISARLIDDEGHDLRRELSHKAIRAVMAECVIIGCQLDVENDRYEYTAYSNSFAKLEEGQTPPVYNCLIDTRGDTIAVTFKGI